MHTAAASTVQSQTLEERMANLAKANVVRTTRSLIKKELKRGELTLEGVLLPDLHRSVAKMRVDDLLRCLPNVGKTKAASTCRRLAIRPSLYVYQLSPPRRQQLVDVVSRFGKRPSRRSTD